MSARLKVTLKVLIIILLLYLSVILLQIIMVSPGTHVVNNHESQSRTNESLEKKQVQN